MHPCYMGVDIGSHEELIAHQLDADIARICASIGADSLGYLSHAGLMEAVTAGIPARVDHRGRPVPVGHCSACFTGVYPLEHDASAPGCA
jgi:amidophosphoribosyltransferase